MLLILLKSKSLFTALKARSGSDGMTRFARQRKAQQADSQIDNFNLNSIKGLPDLPAEIRKPFVCETAEKDRMAGGIP